MNSLWESSTWDKKFWCNLLGNWFPGKVRSYGGESIDSNESNYNRLQSNDNRLEIWGRVGWMLHHPDCNHLHRWLLVAIHQFHESKRKGIRDCECCYPCTFSEPGRDWKYISPYKTPSLIGPFRQPELAEWVR